MCDSSCYILTSNNQFEQSYWSVYPNPVIDNLFVSPLIGQSYFELEIINTNGQVIQHEKYKHDEKDFVSINYQT